MARLPYIYHDRIVYRSKFSELNHGAELVYPLYTKAVSNDGKSDVSSQHYSGMLRLADCLPVTWARQRERDSIERYSRG